MKCYNRTNACDRCGINFDIATGNPHRERDKEGNWTGKWDCLNCWHKFDPFSSHNTIRALRDRRTGNLDPNSSSAKGDKFEELTCRWKGVKKLSKENDSYTGPLDHSPDSEGKIFQTKGKLYDSYNQCWLFSRLQREWEKDFDFEICYCVSKDGKTIERIYMLPKSEITMVSIGIYKNPTDSHGSPKIPWYEQYRITNEEEIRKINDIWKEIIKK